jgi:hypothetical protein
MVMIHTVDRLHEVFFMFGGDRATRVAIGSKVKPRSFSVVFE